MTNKSALIIYPFLLVFFYAPAVYLVVKRTQDILKIYVLHRTDYAFVSTPLTDNICNRRYGTHAEYRVSNNKDTIIAMDGCIMGASKNDMVKIYYNKHHIKDNGIVWVLIRNSIFSFIYFAVLSAFFIWRLIDYFRPATKHHHEK